MKPALVYDARVGRWRYLGSFVPTATGNALAVKRVREGKPIVYIDPAGRAREVAARRVVAYPAPVAARRRVPVVAVAPPPVPMAIPEITAADPTGIFVELMSGLSGGEWDSRILPSGAVVLDGPGDGYDRIAVALRTLAQSDEIMDAFAGVPKMLIRFRCALHEGGFEWIFGSYAIDGRVALMQSIGSLEKWAVRYPDARVVGIELWLH